MSNSSERVSSMASLIKDGFLEMLKGVHTMLPGVIESFNATTQRAKVQLGTGIKLADGREIKHPPLLNVPVQFLRYGGFSLTMPVAAGDEVAVFFSERAIDTFLRTGEAGKVPDTGRFFSLTDSFAVPGLNSNGKIVPDYNSQDLELKADSGNCILKISLDGEFTVTADKDALIQSLLTATIQGAIAAQLKSGTNTAMLNVGGGFHVNNATGDLTTITQSMLAILAPLLTGTPLTNYNALLAQRATFLV